MIALDNIKIRFADSWKNSKARASTGLIGKVSGGLLSTLLLLSMILGFLWDSEPDLFDVEQNARSDTDLSDQQGITGRATVATLMRLADTLLGKPGGYLSNDIMPPGIWMDNVPNWEFGVLVQIRDMSRTLRNSFSRSQSQSIEDRDLVNAENQFYIDNDKWIWPESETEYYKGIDALQSYLHRLSAQQNQKAQFYARADNLRSWLSEVETRLGSLSHRLSASVGKRQLDTSLAGDSAATQSTQTNREMELKTPWTKLDDVFYEARGTSWALIHLLKAAEIDFKGVLQKKNALVSLRQIIRELEVTQETLWSPLILNGSGFGLIANHSLVMASYISRANAAIIDLRSLLEKG